MKTNMNEFDMDIIPPDIIEKAREITRFMEKRGYVNWEIAGICSRNHADKVRVYERYFEFKKENKLV